MKILAIETSGKTSSVCISEKEKLICQFYLDGGLKHSQTIMPMIQSSLDLSKINIHDIDVIAVSKGPGSFTGIRIGVSVAKGIAEGIDKKVVGVPTLKALAENISFQIGIICPLMDARRNQVYGGIYESDGKGKLTQLVDDFNISVEEFFEKLLKIEKNNKNIFFLGDGSEICYTYSKSMNLSKNIILAPKNHRLPRANSVANICFKMLEEGFVAQEPMALVPQYLRLAQAQRERLESDLSANTNF